MKRITIILALALALPLAACGGDDNGDADANVGDPPVPALGTQQDRAGRPAITAATIAAFPFLGGPDKAEYNADGNVAGWIAAYQPTIQAHIAIYDSLDTATVDGGGCNATDNAGNALRPLVLDQANPEPPYAVLATVLADDRLYIDSTLSTCGDGGYLAVEANFALGAPLNDCGGRTPTMDVVDTSYTALATGLQSPVGDGVAADADGPPPVATFPFLNEPSGN